jgi:hypothetical protein
MMCWDDAHCKQIADFVSNATCEAHNACILPQTDPSHAHDEILFNLTQATCETANLGVSLLMVRQAHFSRNAVIPVAQFV